MSALFHPAGTARSRSGLDPAEARRRLLREGANELPRQHRRRPLRVLFDVLREPMLSLLLAGGAIYLLLGEPVDAMVLLVFATFSVSVTALQESRTERILESLRDLTSPRARVLRGGRQLRIAGREVVRGDLLLLAEGDRVPADAWLLEAQELMLDESLLTGESVPVAKRALSDAPPTDLPPPGGDDAPAVFAGALVVHGGGIAEVAATGPRSAIGRIGGSLAAISTELSPLQREVRRALPVLVAVAAVVSLGLVLLRGLADGDWAAAGLAGIALGMSMLPEELPVVLAVFTTVGAWRISRAGVLTRRAAAIEGLGAVTVLCTDKTGTLTCNRMAVAELWTLGSALHPVGQPPSAPESQGLLRAALLAGDVEPTDPMERALHEYAGELAGDWLAALMPVSRSGLRPGRMAIIRRWRAADGTVCEAAKGAPEAVADLCGLPPEERRQMQQQVAAMAERGLRVLAVAFAEGPAGSLRWVGLVGLADPLREDVPDAVALCRGAGIRVVMITGDHPATALAIAAQAGIDHQAVATGDELAAADEADLHRLVSEVSVFARVDPSQKLRIVRALQAAGEVVAMTGDGVNDAPSLRAADVGIAMGGRGTDVAREAAALVLLDDDFGQIVDSVALGRRIGDNLRKAALFICAVHVPIAILALVPWLGGLPVVLWPVHIALLEMVIDPVCSVAFEAEPAAADLMRRPPRSPTSGLLAPPLLLWGLLQGAAASLVPLAVLFLGQASDWDAGRLRTAAFLSLVAAIVGLILASRAGTAASVGGLFRRNQPLLWVLLTLVLLLGVALHWPPAMGWFRFSPLQPTDWLWAAMAPVTPLALHGLRAFAGRWRPLTPPG
jgi:Ca2+-transporting ATPase